MEAQLKSEEVRMVMDALRNAKRFHVTLRFIADPGLKDATDLGGSLFFFFGINEADGYWQSTTCNRLTKGFLLNNFFSSTTLTRCMNH